MFTCVALDIAFAQWLKHINIIKSLAQLPLHPSYIWSGLIETFRLEWQCEDVVSPGVDIFETVREESMFSMRSEEVVVCVSHYGLIEFRPGRVANLRWDLGVLWYFTAVWSPIDVRVCPGDRTTSSQHWERKWPLSPQCTGCALYLCLYLNLFTFYLLALACSDDRDLR